MNFDLFISFILYFFSGLALLFLGILVFELGTKTKEFQLIKAGNRAASYAFGGRIIGLAVVLYSAIANSVDVMDMVIWGIIAIIAQMLSFYIFEWATPNFDVHKAIDEDNQAFGLLLLFVSVAIGIVIAGCLVY